MHIRGECLRVIKGADPEARLFVWYAGHGHTQGGEGFLVPADAPLAHDPMFKVTALHMRDFGGLMRLAESKHVLSVFDSCFSGSVFKTKALPDTPPHITASTSKPVRQFISAGSANQQVPAKSVFQPLFLLLLLRGEVRPRSV